MDAVSRLRQISFLEHLLPEEFEALAKMMDLRPFLAGDTILTQGEPTTNFYIVDSGSVNMRFTDRAGYEKAIGSKGEGGFFGVKMFTTQEPSEYTFEAVGKAAMWVVERQDWDALLEQFPDVLEHMPELNAEYRRLTHGLNWLIPGEVVEFMTRRHWWGLLLMMRLPALIAFIFTVGYLISVALNVTTQLPWVLTAYGVVMGICGFWALYAIVQWRNDYFIVTNKRIVRVDRVLFFSDSRNEIPIEKIQAQNVTRGGPISVLLNISDLRITSAASDTSGLVFDQVGNVQRLQGAIGAQFARINERKSAAEREKLRAMIASDLHHYIAQEPVQPDKVVSSPPPASSSRKFLFIFPLGKAASKPKPKPKPKAGGWGSVWKSIYATEMRDGKNVTWRKHHFVLFRQIFWGLIALAAIMLLGTYVFFGGVPFSLSANGIYGALAVFSIPALIFIWWEWADWRVDLYKLSETGIVDIESLPFGLRYSEKKAEISKIQDTKVSRPHLMNVLLDFGNVEVRVAGNAEPFTFNSISKPNLVADEINARIEALKVSATERATREQTRQIVDAIVAYHRLVVTERAQTEAQAAAAQAAAAPPPEPEPPPPPPPAPIARPSLQTDTEFPPEE